MLKAALFLGGVLYFISLTTSSIDQKPIKSPVQKPWEEVVKSQKGNGGHIQSRQLVTQTANVTCVCVPAGQCTNSVVNDGSGQIDIRIVNNDSTITTTASPTVVPPSACQYGLVQCCMYGPYMCGTRYQPITNSLTAGPGQASYGEYPWQAALLTLTNVYFGSGALISSQYVLTAAHKVAVVPTASMKVRLGEWNASASVEPIPPQDFTVSTVISHPNFNPNNLRNSIALIKLSSAVQLGQVPTIATACLPATTFSGQSCWVSGWGKNDFTSPSLQSVQREVDVVVRLPAVCQAALAATRLGPNFAFDTASFICAGGVAGKDACTGDGGSPLVCQQGSQWYVVGLVAWGIGCGTQNVPGVYTNVLTYIPWIQTIISS